MRQKIMQIGTRTLIDVGPLFVAFLITELIA